MDSVRYTISQLDQLTCRLCDHLTVRVIGFSKEWQQVDHGPVKARSIVVKLSRPRRHDSSTRRPYVVSSCRMVCRTTIAVGPTGNHRLPSTTPHLEVGRPSHNLQHALDLVDLARPELVLRWVNGTFSKKTPRLAGRWCVSAADPATVDQSNSMRFDCATGRPV